MMSDILTKTSICGFRFSSKIDGSAHQSQFKILEIFEDVGALHKVSEHLQMKTLWWRGVVQNVGEIGDVLGSWAMGRSQELP